MTVINENYTPWPELMKDAEDLIDKIDEDTTEDTTAANNAVAPANSAAASAMAAALAIGNKLDCLVIIDEDTETKFMAKCRIIGGNPTLRCTIVNS